MKSGLTDVTILTNNYDSRGGYGVDRITIHHMAGNLTAEQCGYVFQTREASANYGIDSNGRVGCYVLEEYRAWSTANYDNDKRAINIELADDGGAPDWHISDIAIEKCIQLCVDICKRYGFRLNYTGDTNGNLTMHCWFVSTTCPGPYLASKYQYIADEVNRRLDGGEPTPAPTPTPTPSGDARIRDFQATLNRCYGTAPIEEDGIFGPDTLRKAVVGLQAEFNSQLGANLEIDGIFGPATKEACPNTSIGDAGPITYITQSLLICRGYAINNDSIFGTETESVVKQFQANNGLYADGICGGNTYEALCE